MYYALLLHCHTESQMTGLSPGCQTPFSLTSMIWSDYLITMLQNNYRKGNNMGSFSHTNIVEKIAIPIKMVSNTVWTEQDSMIFFHDLFLQYHVSMNFYKMTKLHDFPWHSKRVWNSRIFHDWMNPTLMLLLSCFSYFFEIHVAINEWVNLKGECCICCTEIFSFFKNQY